MTQFGQDTDKKVRQYAAEAALSFADNLAEQGDLSGYQQVIAQFGQDTDYEVRQYAVKAAFGLAENLAKQGDWSAYTQAITQFGQDEDKKVRLRAAESALSLAFNLSKKQGDFSGYSQIVAQFGQDKHNPIRLQAAQAAFNLALELDKQGDLSAYEQVVAQFGRDKHNETRLRAAKAAYILAKALYKQNPDPDVFLPAIQQFANDSAASIRKAVFHHGTMNRINWLVVVGRQQEAQEEIAAALKSRYCGVPERAVLRFLLWLSDPNAANQAACRKAVNALKGKKPENWIFVEFAELIAGMLSEQQQFANEIIALLEERS